MIEVCVVYLFFLVFGAYLCSYVLHRMASACNARKVLKFKLLTPDARLPKYAHSSDSGMDVRSVQNVVIMPGRFKLIRTGLAAEVPRGCEIQVRPRSGLQCKNGIVGGWGTVDEGYRGEIGVVLYNHSSEPFRVSVGDRIAQLVVAPVVRVRVVAVDKLSTETDRGVGGFGSTGK